MKQSNLNKIKNMSLRRKIVLILIIAVVICSITIIAIALLNGSNNIIHPEQVTLTFYDEDKEKSEEVIVPYGSTISDDISPNFEKKSHYIAAWSYLNSENKYLRVTDKMTIIMIFSQYT